jgi:hypothetical protein
MYVSVLSLICEIARIDTYSELTFNKKEIPYLGGIRRERLVVLKHPM